MQFWRKKINKKEKKFKTNFKRKIANKILDFETYGSTSEQKNTFTHIKKRECIIFSICNIKNSNNKKDINKVNIFATKSDKSAKKFGINKILQIFRLKK